jgi:hypothetical protein
MSSELLKLRDSLVTMDQPQEEQASATASMVRFLPDNIKFTMPIPPKDFALKSMPPRMPPRPDITIRPTNDVPCGVLSDAARPKQGKGKSIRGRPGDIALMTAMANGRVHIYGETEEIVTRAGIVWRKGFQTPAKREAIAKQLHSQHLKEKAIAIAEYRPLIKQ